MNDWQKRMTSSSLLPCGSKLDPPLAPPMGSVVSAFFRTCSKARNFKRPKFTEEWNLRPPLYGPMALLISTRYPRLIWISPESSTHGTRNMMTRSGSIIRSSSFCSR